jgi:hypothetical protein
VANATRKPSADLGDFFAVMWALVLFGGVPFYLAVWRNVPVAYWVKWAALGVAFALALGVYLIAKHQKWDWLQQLARTRGKRAGDLLVFFVLAAAVAFAVVWFAEEEQTMLLKLFVVIYFSLLPAILYVQFIATRARTAWDEYVLNLYQLHVDDYRHLPPPPRASRYYELWSRTRGGAGEKSSSDTIYQRKFEALFGKVDPTRTTAFASLRSENVFLVSTATLLIAVGWVIVVDPETVWGWSFMPADFSLSGLPAIPHETFAFAFLGAYFYILQMLVRRYFQSDLKTSAYINATMRIVVAILIVWTLDLVLRDQLSQSELSAIAFVVGVFPTAGWQALQQLVKRLLGVVVPSMREDFPLSDLDGLNIWYESRLLEEGVEDMQNLATANIVDVMLNTRIPVDRLVDWIDQSLLYLRVEGEAPRNGESDRRKLRRRGIRTATDLQDAFAYADAGRGGRGFKLGLERLLNDADGELSATRSILATLETERNLQHVREWKSFRADPGRPRRPRAVLRQNGAKRNGGGTEVAPVLLAPGRDEPA